MVSTKGNHSAFVCAADGAGGVGINQRDGRRVIHSCQIELSPAHVGLWGYLTEMGFVKTLKATKQQKIKWRMRRGSLCLVAPGWQRVQTLIQSHEEKHANKDLK